MNSDERIKLLSTMRLFSRVGQRDLERIAGIATESSFSSGTAIVDEGDAAVRMYIIGEGAVEVTQERDGNSVIIDTIGKGGFFGELALFESFPRNATVRAIDDVSCLILTDQDVYAELRETPDVAIGLLKELARRLRVTDAELAELKMRSAS